MEAGRNVRLQPEEEQVERTNVFSSLFSKAQTLAAGLNGINFNYSLPFVRNAILLIPANVASEQMRANPVEREQGLRSAREHLRQVERLPQIGGTAARQWLQIEHVENGFGAREIEHGLVAAHVGERTHVLVTELVQMVVFEVSRGPGGQLIE